ncbi:MAG: VIT family protein [Actinobacteria bacterium]|jgi:VIT1/CCC1 family predicted Fe2+/Mn2+ transporter|nr:VIT family protein [Actinomycetota bacterium]NCV42781.1 VIT family protein [Actinomycetota bacterium]NCV82671.1 VIT family protein [Actinomycetota bacterium]NCW71762.1 VIT family protein [Actinomycetota bacterium]NCW92249.1 VIT family protein [Actinomycetota bacterium]
MALEDVYQRNLHHRTHRAGWLRAAVLGANDGLVSTASLMIGVAAAGKTDFLLTAGLAGISAGAMSMAVGEYVSVRSQNDVEESDRQLEIEHLAADPQGELLELQHIYIERGLSPELALTVAQEMHKKDPLAAHLRDELGQHPHTKARPVQAAIASALSFTAGGFIPFLGAFAPTLGAKAWSIVAFTVLGLVITGILSARTAGSKVLVPTLRVIIGGCLGMLITAGIGRIAHISGI